MARNNNNNRNNNEQVVRGLSVEVKNNDIGRALRKFKKMVQDDGILQEVKERQHYNKPSIVKRRAKAAARARWLKKLSSMNQD